MYKMFSKQWAINITLVKNGYSISVNVSFYSPLFTTITFNWYLWNILFQRVFSFNVFLTFYVRVTDNKFTAVMAWLLMSFGNSLCHSSEHPMLLPFLSPITYYFTMHLFKHLCNSLYQNWASGGTRTNDLNIIGLEKHDR